MSYMAALRNEFVVSNCRIENGLISLCVCIKWGGEGVICV